MQKAQKDAFTEKTKDFKAKLAAYNKVLQKKPPEEPIVPDDPGDYEAATDSEDEDIVQWVHVKILHKASGKERTAILMATDFQKS